MFALQFCKLLVGSCADCCADLEHMLCSYDSLRQVPAYSAFLKERFERCLDLYLCPRTRKHRVSFGYDMFLLFSSNLCPVVDVNLKKCVQINIDPESLIPKLPKPKDLQPFPTTCYIEYRGHSKAVTTIATDPSGEWLASGTRVIICGLGAGSLSLVFVLSTKHGHCVQHITQAHGLNFYVFLEVVDAALVCYLLFANFCLQAENVL